jgi:hypothetical protein
MTPREFSNTRRLRRKNLCVYGEHSKSLSPCSLTTPRDIKVCISQLIIIQTQNIFRFFLSTLYGMDLAKKTISRYCPFKHGPTISANTISAQSIRQLSPLPRLLFPISAKISLPYLHSSNPLSVFIFLLPILISLFSVNSIEQNCLNFFKLIAWQIFSYV